MIAELSHLWIRFWVYLKANPPFLISLSALALTVYQIICGQIDRRRASKPHLSITIEVLVLDGKAIVSVSNNGIGPAVIKKFDFMIDGKAIPPESFTSYYDAIYPIFEKLGCSLIVATPGNKYCIGSKEEMKLLDITFIKPYPKRDVVLTALKRLSVTFSYRSFYGEKFKLTEVFAE